MKAKLVLACLLPAVLLSSCIVKSLHPFYTAETLVFREDLAGNWVDQGEAKWQINRSAEKENAYEVSLTTDKSSALFTAHLFQLDNTLYLDFVPQSYDATTVNFSDLHFIPSHSLARVRLEGDDSINIDWLNEEWLAELFAQNRIRIKHEVIQDGDSEDDRVYVLTASTEELQKFLLKYGDEPGAFERKPDAVMNLNFSLSREQ